MLRYLKQNGYLIMVIIVLCCLLAKSNYNNGLIKNDTVNYKTVTSKNEAIDAAMIPETIVKNFTKIKTITKTINTVRIDTVKIVYKDTVECVFNRSGRLKSDYYSFDYLSNNKGFKIANLEIPDSLTVVTGQKRKWFLGQPVNTIAIYHSNKYIDSGKTFHVEVVEKKKFYQTNLFKFSVGFALGAYITK